MTVSPPRPSWRHPWRRLADHLASRLPRTDVMRLTQGNLYVLPSRAGWMLGITLLVMLVGSINYQLNLGYVLTFLLAGSAVVGLHVGHGTLRGLTLKLTPPPPAFADAAVPLDITLISERRRTRFGIGAAVSPGGDWAHIDVPAQGSARVQVGWKAPGRGRHALPALTLETRYPLGTFRIWTVWRPAATVLVYPAPERQPPPLPPARPKEGGDTVRVAGGSGEPDGVRAYRRGDPLKAVVWKRAAQAMARGSADLVSREQAQSAQLELWLDAQHTGTADLELRASRLTAWVLLADRMGVDYGLRLPQRTVPVGQGMAHRLTCLEALALC